MSEKADNEVVEAPPLGPCQVCGHIVAQGCLHGIGPRKQAVEGAVEAVPEAYRRTIADWIREYVEPGVSPEGDEKTSIRRRLAEHLAWKLDGRDERE